MQGLLDDEWQRARFKVGAAVEVRIETLYCEAKEPRALVGHQILGGDALGECKLELRPAVDELDLLCAVRIRLAVLWRQQLAILRRLLKGVEVLLLGVGTNVPELVVRSVELQLDVKGHGVFIRAPAVLHLVLVDAPQVVEHVLLRDIVPFRVVGSAALVGQTNRQHNVELAAAHKHGLAAVRAHLVLHQRVRKGATIARL